MCTLVGNLNLSRMTGLVNVYLSHDDSDDQPSSHAEHTRGSTTSSSRQNLTRDASREQRRTTTTDPKGSMCRRPYELSIRIRDTSTRVIQHPTKSTRRTTPASQPTCCTSAPGGGGIARTYAVTVRTNVGTLHL